VAQRSAKDMLRSLPRFAEGGKAGESLEETQKRLDAQRELFKSLEQQRSQFDAYQTAKEINRIEQERYAELQADIEKNPYKNVDRSRYLIQKKIRAPIMVTMGDKVYTVGPPSGMISSTSGGVLPEEYRIVDKDGKQRQEDIVLQRRRVAGPAPSAFALEKPEFDASGYQKALTDLEVLQKQYADMLYRPTPKPASPPFPPPPPPALTSVQELVLPPQNLPPVVASVEPAARVDRGPRSIRAAQAAANLTPGVGVDLGFGYFDRLGNYIPAAKIVPIEEDMTNIPVADTVRPVESGIRGGLSPIAQMSIPAADISSVYSLRPMDPMGDLSLPENRNLMPGVGVDTSQGYYDRLGNFIAAPNLQPIGIGTTPVFSYREGGEVDAFIQRANGGSASSSGVRRLKMSGYQEGGDVTDEMFVGTRPEDFPETSSVDKKAGELLRALSEGTRGFVGAEPIEPGSEAYRTGQALANMPAVGVVAATAKGAGKSVDQAKALMERMTPELEKFLKDSVVKERLYRGQRRAPAEEGFALTQGRGTPSFTTDTEVANVYSRQLGFGNPEYGPGSTVVPAYVQMKNPLDIRDLGEYIDLESFVDRLPNVDLDKPTVKNGFGYEDIAKMVRGIGSVASKTGAKYEIEAYSPGSIFRVTEFDELADAIEELGEAGKSEKIQEMLFDTSIDAFLIGDSKNVKNALKEKGFDGVIHKDAFDVGGQYYQGDPKNLEGGTYAEYIHDSYRPFFQEKIKSAIGNVGTYDTTKKAITKAKGGEVTNDEFIQEMMTGTRPTDETTSPGILPPEIQKPVDVGLDFANMALRGTAAAVAGPAYGLYKGITGGKYGTREGVTEARSEAERMMGEITGEPKTQAARDITEYVGEKLEEAKIPPMPQFLTMPLPAPGSARAAMRALDMDRPPTGAVTLAAPPTPSLDSLGMSSRLSEAVDRLQARGTGEQLLAQLNKAQGVPQAEIKATGLDEFLKSAGKVTRDDIQGYLEKNRVNLVEDERSFAGAPIDDLSKKTMGKEFPYLRGDFFNRRYANLDQVKEAGYNALKAERDELQEQFTYGDLDSFRDRDGFEVLPDELDDWLQRENDYLEQYIDDIALEDSRVKHNQLTLPGGDNYREVLFKLPKKEGQPAFIPPASHYEDAANTFGSIRMTDRVVDGKPILFAEEVQSDWAIKGAKEGYDEPEKAARRNQQLSEARQALAQAEARAEAAKNAFQNRGPQDESLQLLGNMEFAQQNAEKVRRFIQALEIKATPENPFKNNWYQPVMNRFLIKAAQEGKEGIGLTNGEVHIQRYNLRNYTDKVIYNPKTKLFAIFDRATDDVAKNIYQNIDEPKLRRMIGDETAEKLLNSGSKTDSAMGDDIFVLSGNQLEIGGGGKNTFYDKILPDYLNKLGKKYGVKVETRMLPAFDDRQKSTVNPLGRISDEKAREIYYLPLTEEMRNDLLGKGLPTFKKGGEVTNDEFIQQVMTGTPMSDTSTRPGILPPELREAIDVPLDFANLLIRGTAAVPIGGVAGLYKGLTGGKYGTQEGVKEADTEAARMMAEITGEPKTQTAKDVLQFVGDKMQEYKLDAALPQLLTLPSPGAGTTEFIKQAVRSEFEAPPVGAVTLKPDASTDLETAAPAAGGASIRPEQLDQLTSQTVIRGQDIPPLTKIPTPEEIRVAKADTRMGQNIVADRLNIIVPETERVRGGIYRAGQPSGRPWSELTPEQLKQRDSGFKGTDSDLDKMWQETLSEVSEAGRIAVERTGATWKAFPAKNWDNAFKLPLRNQLWYELSGEAFVDRMPDTTTREMLTFLDLIGATSARAKPLENLERSVAISAQKLQGVPVDVDVTIPSTVKDALRREGTNISSDLANKTGNFSDTLALTGGLPVRYPISVNDVWVGNAFGITDQQLGANQALHEVFARYMNKVRDFHNETGNPLYPHESWQVQARQWVEMRANALGIDTSKLDTVEGSDYAAEFDKVVKKLENAGISVPDGILTRDVLLDPRIPDALRTTTKAFREAPKATVEFGTLLTPSGKRGAELFKAAKAVGDELTQKEYLKVLTSSMYDSARGKPTPWQNLVRVATNRAESVTRIYSPTSQDPFAISGTFQGAAGPNIRIPFRDMTPDQIAYANAVAGSGLKQKAMAAAEIRRLELNDPIPKGYVQTNSIKFDIDGPVPESLLVDITKELGEGFEVSAMRYPDGLMVDINPRFGDAGPEAATVEAIDRATDMLEERYKAKGVKAFRSAYRSEFGKNYVEDPGTGTEYNRIIQETLKGWNDEAITRITDLAGKSVKRSDISKFLAGKLDALPIDASKLPEGTKADGVRGRTQTIRKQLRQRISDHNESVKAFESIGQSVDGAMAKAVPTWEKRAQSQRKKLTTASTAQPVARRRGKGTTSAAEDLAAVSPTAPAVSRVDMGYKDVTKRVPELTKGANDLLEGKITWEDYNALVDQYKPVTPYSFVPQPATGADAMKALDSRKQKSFAVIQEGIKAGETAELRLDIPAYKDHGVWVNSIHRSGQPTSYASISSIKNARMIGPDDVRLQEKALEVATGQKTKGPFAVIKGEWSPVSEKEAVARAQQYLNDPEWTQVGYDPERHSYFYDRTTTQPVVSADEVLQIGPLVLAKNAKFAKKEQFKFKSGGEVNAFIKAKAK
jgi:hypothetical protein